MTKAHILPEAKSTQAWFQWAAMMVTGVLHNDNWNSRNHSRFNMVLASAAYSVAGAEGRITLQESKGLIGRTLKNHARDGQALFDKDAAPAMRDTLVTLLDALAEKTPRLAFDVITEVRAALNPQAQEHASLHTKLSLRREEIGRALNLGLSHDAVETARLKRAALVREPVHPGSQFAYDLYASLTSGTRFAVPKAA